MTDLRNYISTIKKSKDLKTIKRKVSTKYEIAGLTAKVDNSYAVMFENIKGNKFRLISNLVGTRKRFAQAVNTTEDKIHEKVFSAIRNAKKPKLSKKPKFLENYSRSSKVIPIVTHFEKESGPFITSSIFYAENPETGKQNSSFHRMMPIDEKNFSVRMVEGRHLHRCFIDAKEHGEDLKVAVSIGVHPAVSIAGAYQAEWGKDELYIANAILNGKLTITKCPFSGLEIPSGTEILLEGRILKDKTHKEWMVEMLQTYDRKRSQPVFEIDSIRYRNNPIFHDILSGYSEHRLLMGMPIEAKLNGEIKKYFKQTKSISLTNGGCNWLHAVVKIKKRRDSDPQKIIKKIFEIHRSVKQVTIVDEDVDINNADAVEYALATRFQADNDLVILKNVRGSSLDPSSDQKNLKTSKMGIDATKSLKKDPIGFEIAKIPGIDKIRLDDYFQ
ncbi:MAG: UbiD family decarboxylase [Nitrosopumilaceae archaeon]|nr:UbiD family decarboxylase [Nitrosopumilaceae archaeon]NIT99945.1 UbiD family decarboxylase [Nitrosopumilaceae archaeon]NIU86299.1 UbiD family decarboxylase [Nitrosopumilaceae archaeon]NIV65054.1 UbiD family decarboxylase [Nitrosopumilaceae archaeon]NIX60548.1 UbiD family decarboxylase [Nitrosopumilaceae archaeon]